MTFASSSHHRAAIWVLVAEYTVAMPRRWHATCVGVAHGNARAPAVHRHCARLLMVAAAWAAFTTGFVGVVASATVLLLRAIIVFGLLLYLPRDLIPTATLLVAIVASIAAVDRN